MQPGMALVPAFPAVPQEQCSKPRSLCHLAGLGPWGHPKLSPLSLPGSTPGPKVEVLSRLTGQLCTSAPSSHLIKQLCFLPLFPSLLGALLSRSSRLSPPSPSLCSLGVLAALMKQYSSSILLIASPFLLFVGTEPFCCALTAQLL